MAMPWCSTPDRPSDWFRLKRPPCIRAALVPPPHAGESARMLEDLALGRRVRLFYPGITRDRYDRALAHVMTIDGIGPTIWLNRVMLERGEAWVRLYPSTAKRRQDLLIAEAAARREQRGLWALSQYRSVEARRLGADVRGFRIVSAVLGEPIPVDPSEPYAPTCPRSLEGSLLTLSVRRAAASTCGMASARAVTLRGYVSDGTLELSHPWHLELGEED